MSGLTILQDTQWLLTWTLFFQTGFVKEACKEE